MPTPRALRPELVNLEDAVSQVPENVIKINEKVDIIWDIKELTGTGATGDPTKASIEKGEQMLEIFVDLVASTIEEMNQRGWEY